MISRKDDKLVDLEYMIPKEFKEDPRSDVEEEAVAGARGGWSCHFCNRTSHEATLLPVVHMGEKRLICPRCLKKAIDSDIETPSYGALGAIREGSPEPTISRGSEYSSPMSMFD